MFKAREHQLVLGPCPGQGGLVATHAFLTARRFARRKGPLHYWCAACGSAHRAEAESLRLARASDALRAAHPQGRASKA